MKSCYLSFSVWLISLSTTPSRSIHVVADGNISLLFYSWVILSCLPAPLLYPSTDEHVSYLPILPIIIMLQQTYVYICLFELVLWGFLDKYPEVDWSFFVSCYSLCFKVYCVWYKYCLSVCLFLFLWNTFFHPFTFSLCVSFGLESVVDNICKGLVIYLATLSFYWSI